MWRFLLLTTSLLIGAIQALDEPSVAIGASPPTDAPPTPAQNQPGTPAPTESESKKEWVTIPDAVNCTSSDDAIKNYFDNCKKKVEDDEISLQVINPELGVRFTPNICTNKFNETVLHLDQSIWKCLYRNVKNVDSKACVAEVYNMYDDEKNRTQFPLYGVSCEKPNEDNTVQIVDRKGHINVDYSVPDNWLIDEAHIVKLYQSLVNTYAFTNHDIIYTVASYLSEVLGHDKLETLPKLQMHTDIILYLAKLRVNWKDESLSVELQNVMLSFLNDVYLNSISICEPLYKTNSTQCIDVNAIAPDKTFTFNNFKAAMDEESCKDSKDLLFRDTRWSCWADIAANMVDLKVPTSDGETTTDAVKTADIETFFKFDHDSYKKENNFEDDFQADFERETNLIMKDICADEKFDYLFLNNVAHYWGQRKSAHAVDSLFVLLLKNTAQCGDHVFARASLILSIPLVLSPIAMAISFWCAKPRV
jgi:hypothetical protein